jgi:hypothetical protein
MPEETAAEQATSDATVKNTGSASADQQEPSGTQPGTAEAAKSKTSFTPEQQAEIDRVVGKARREEQKKLEKKIQEADLTEAEKLKRENAELQLKIRSRDAEDAIAAGCGKDCTNPKAAVKLAQAIGLEFDDKGKLVNLKDLIAEVKDIAPELFQKRPGRSDSADGVSSSPLGQSMNDVIRRAAGRQ